jgi:hypothetical protein
MRDMTDEQWEEEKRLQREREKAEHKAIMEAIRSVLVQRGDASIFYVCQQIPGGAWACGYCAKGLLGANPQRGDYCSCGAVVNAVERGPAPKTFSTVCV